MSTFHAKDFSYKEKSLLSPDKFDLKVEIFPFALTIWNNMRWSSIPIFADIYFRIHTLIWHERPFHEKFEDKLYAHMTCKETYWVNR